MSVYLKVLKNENVVLLKKAEPGSIGLDISATEKGIIPAKGFSTIKSGLYVEFGWNRSPRDDDPELFMMLQSRSGHAFRNGVFLLTGTIDQSYRGEISIITGNMGDKDVIITPGDRIAQAIIYAVPVVRDISFADSLSDTERGGSGLGSTGA